MALMKSRTSSAKLSKAGNLYKIQGAKEALSLGRLALILPGQNMTALKAAMLWNIFR